MATLTRRIVDARTSLAVQRRNEGQQSAESNGPPTEALDAQTAAQTAQTPQATSAAQPGVVAETSAQNLSALIMRRRAQTEGPRGLGEAVPTAAATDEPVAESAAAQATAANTGSTGSTPFIRASRSQNYSLRAYRRSQSERAPSQGGQGSP